MNLSDIYRNRVQSRRVNSFSTNGFSPVIEKDPIINQLEQNLAAKFQEIIPLEVVESQKPSDITRVGALSVEDALKELIQIQQSFK